MSKKKTMWPLDPNHPMNFPLELSQEELEALMTGSTSVKPLQDKPKPHVPIIVTSDFTEEEMNQLIDKIRNEK